jgi:hypothetical protein
LLGRASHARARVGAPLFGFLYRLRNHCRAISAKMVGGFTVKAA